MQKLTRAVLATFVLVGVSRRAEAGGADPPASFVDADEKRPTKLDSFARSNADLSRHGGKPGLRTVPLNKPHLQIELVEHDICLLECERFIETVSLYDSQLMEFERLGAGQIGLRAKAPGVASMLITDKAANRYLVELQVAGDVRELQRLLDRIYPQADIEAVPVRDAVLLEGKDVDPADVAQIVQVAEQFFPKVIDHLRPGGGLPTQSRVRHSADRSSNHGSNPFVAPGTRSQRQIDDRDLAGQVRQLRREIRELSVDVDRIIEKLERDPPPAQSRTKLEDRLEQRLEKRMSFELINAPLDAVCRQLADSAGVNVVLDARGLEEEGVRPETPVSLSVSGITLRSALKVLLEPLHLTFVVEDEVVKITSHPRAAGPLIVYVYPVGDLAKNDEELQELLEFLKQVEPDSWAEAGGWASIRAASNQAIVVRHHGEAHRQIVELLKELRNLGRQPVPAVEPSE